MPPCDATSELLSLRLDDELDGETADRLAAHLASCATCRELEHGLTRTRDAVAELFESARRSSPPIPSTDRFLPVTAGRARSGLLRSLTAVAAGVLLVALGLYFWPEKAVDMSPAAVLRRATARYRGHEDVELWLTVDSQAARALLALFADDPEDLDMPRQRIFADADGRMLTMSVARFEDPVEKGVVDCGFDGTDARELDEETSTIVLTKSDGIRLEGLFGDSERPRSGAAPDAKALSVLSWDFVSGLSRDEGEFELEDVTTPSVARTGRMTFRIVPRGGAGETHRDVFWTRSVITIDPARDLIERHELDVSLIGLSVFTLTVEVARTDQGLAPSFFRWPSHFPADTPVRRDPPDAPRESR